MTTLTVIDRGTREVQLVVELDEGSPALAGPVARLLEQAIANRWQLRCCGGNLRRRSRLLLQAIDLLTRCQEAQARRSASCALLGAVISQATSARDDTIRTSRSV